MEGVAAHCTAVCAVGYPGGFCREGVSDSETRRGAGSSRSNFGSLASESESPACSANRRKIKPVSRTRETKTVRYGDGDVLFGVKLSSRSTLIEVSLPPQHLDRHLECLRHFQTARETTPMNVAMFEYCPNWVKAELSIMCIWFLFRAVKSSFFNAL